MSYSVLQKIRKNIQQGKAQSIHLASGSIGSVKKIILPDGQEFIVKKRHKTQSLKQINQFQKQSQINQKLMRIIGNKQHIIPHYYGKTTIDNTPYLVFEKMDGDLVSLFRDETFVLSRETKDDMIQQLWNIYNVLKTLIPTFCHGDIHEGNIYYKEINGNIKLFLGDFGTSSIEQKNNNCQDLHDLEKLVQKIENRYKQDLSRQQKSRQKKKQEQIIQTKIKQLKEKNCIPFIKQQATEDPGDRGQCKCDNKR